MPKRKKYPKLPNGYGSIKYLGKGRRNPYAVHPPTTEWTLDGVPKTPPALCYVDDWMKGFAVLTAYKAGTYTPGMEKDLPTTLPGKDTGLAQRLLADFSRIKGTEETHGKTFSEVYEDFFEYKYNRDQSRKYSKASISSTRAAYRNCSSLHNRPFRELRHGDLQAVIDNCGLKYASLELIVSLFHQMYAYADIYELCDKDYSAHVRINRKNDDEHGVPFSKAELETLWGHQDDPVVELLLIDCYSGFRIGEFKGLSVNLKQNYFQGGIKTEASKNRIVPIHSGILGLVRRRMKRDGAMLNISDQKFRNLLYPVLESLGIQKHTPHDCRHTFSALCEKYGVSENDRRRMLGHSFGADITNGIYGHRSLEDLRGEIEKIKICY